MISTSICKSSKDLHQILQVICATSECANKSDAHLINLLVPSCTEKIASQKALASHDAEHEEENKWPVGSPKWPVSQDIEISYHMQSILGYIVSL